MFEEGATNIEWVVIFIFSGYESRRGNFLAALDKDPSDGSARTVVTELFSFCMRLFCPILRTPLEGIFLFLSGEVSSR